MRENTDAEHLGDVLDRFRSVKRRIAVHGKRNATAFNIFEVLQLRPERFHSAVLRELLDPRGSHGQEGMFLKAFVAQCQQDCKFFPRPIGNNLDGDELQPPRLVACS